MKEQMNAGEAKQETGDNNVERKVPARNVNHSYNSWTLDICRVCKLLQPGRGFS